MNQMSRIEYIYRWFRSSVKVLWYRLIYGNRFKVGHGKPLFLGRGARIRIGKEARVVLGSGVHLEDGCLLQSEGVGIVELGNRVFLNESVRVVAVESIAIGDRTLFGPNAMVYDHDHVYDRGGVCSSLCSSPVSIGAHCWLAANSIVTRGVSVSDAIVVGASSVVTGPLLEPGLYVGSPAKMKKR